VPTNIARGLPAVHPPPVENWRFSPDSASAAGAPSVSPCLFLRNARIRPLLGHARD
jgi:hypothetical protein